MTNYEERDFSPAFSPDSSSIAFVCEESSSEREQKLAIYLMDSNGQDARKIASGGGIDRYVSWSPDGKFLIYAARRLAYNSGRLTVMELEKTKAHNIDFDRTDLKCEITATEPQAKGLLARFTQNIAKKIDSGTYRGGERYPDWIF